MTAPSSHYDTVIIGAGMSGLAAGIRLAHFGRKVCLFERHYAAGGLNSFYSLGGRKYDVGLHAVTNYVAPGRKGTPLGKLLRQLRIDRDEFGLCPQRQSRVAFGPHGETALRFTNDPAVLEGEIAAAFPRQIDGFRRLVGALAPYEAASTPGEPVSARAVVRRHFSDPLLEDLLFCPLLYYGGPRERDMDFVEFSVMFRSILLEGLGRPYEGIRRIIRVLQDKYRAAGGERRMKCGVQHLVVRGRRVVALRLDDGGEVTADHVLSCAGAAETARLWRETPAEAGPERSDRRLSFVETIRVLREPAGALGWGDDTIVFFNDSDRFEYARPDDQVDPRSGVICLPDNFDYRGREFPEGQVRVTCLANPAAWSGLPEERYRDDKRRWFERMTESAGRFLPSVAPDRLSDATVATDMFTPRTITRFTGHLEGAVYGAPEKHRDGLTPLRNLFLCGTDQGLLGIVGSMLSGITIANRHILRPGNFPPPDARTST